MPNAVLMGLTDPVLTRGPILFHRYSQDTIDEVTLSSVCLFLSVYYTSGTVEDSLVGKTKNSLFHEVQSQGRVLDTNEVVSKIKALLQTEISTVQGHWMVV